MKRFLTAMGSVFIFLLSQTVEAQWQPPRGIPTPAFGIDETAQNHCDNCNLRTQSNLDDLDDIPPGSIIEIAPGDYDGGNLVIGGSGTAAQPIFVRGKEADSRPRIMQATTISGSYIIVENIEFDFSHEDRNLTIEGDHIALRHSEVHDFYPGHHSTTVFISDSTDIVIYADHIHDNGDFTFSGEQDVHGIGAWGAHRVWVVDSHLHHNRGDSIQLGHRAGNALGDFYIGRNLMHDDGENRVDIKETSNVVITENRFYNPTEGYPHIVLHDCPENAAVLYNEFEGDTGIQSGSLEDACNSRTPISLFMIGNQLDLIDGWGTGKNYFICGNSGSVDIDNPGPESVLTSTDDARCFDAFYKAYGINLDDSKKISANTR
jgi:hypothetical protein